MLTAIVDFPERLFAFTAVVRHPILIPVLRTQRDGSEQWRPNQYKYVDAHPSLGFGERI
jgi:hypothetical protein